MLFSKISEKPKIFEPFKSYKPFTRHKAPLPHMHSLNMNNDHFGVKYRSTFHNLTRIAKMNSLQCKLYCSRIVFSSSLNFLYWFCKLEQQYWSGKLFLTCILKYEEKWQATAYEATYYVGTLQSCETTQKGHLKLIKHQGVSKY